MSRPIARASVPDLVFADLREAILAGFYAPGERLPTQRTLAAELDVNIAAVREALGRLEQLRLIETRHGEGMRVLDWRRSGGLDALALLGGIDQQVVAPLFEARRLLLREAARLAADRRTEPQAAALDQLATAVTIAREDDAALLADWAYMSTIVEASGNLIFQLIMNSVRELYLPKAESFVPVVAARKELAPLYRRGADAIRAGDAARAVRAIGALAGAQEQRMLAGISAAP